MSDKVIKSVRRVFEILELFDKERRPLSANEIARQLNYPLTSAHALLKSLDELGYADFDKSDWTYTPSRQISVVVDWVNDLLDREPGLLDFLVALNQQTQETINLSRRVGDQARIIHGLESIHALGVSVKVGTLMTVTAPLTGICMLCTLDPPELDAYLQQLESADSKGSHIDRKLIAGIIDELRNRGSVMRCDLLVAGIGAVCLPMRTHLSRELMVIGVVGPSERIRRDERAHRRTLKRLVTEFGIDSVFRLKNPRKSVVEVS